jgi:hypothetical protein
LFVTGSKRFPDSRPDMGDAPAQAEYEARQLIETIARDHTLDGAIFGTKFESLVNNCLEM